MKMKKLLATLLAGTMALSLAACGGNGGGSSGSGSSDGSGSSGGGEGGSGPYKISMVLKTNSSEFWQLVQAGAETYAKENPDLVELSVKGPPRVLLRGTAQHGSN